MLKMFTHSFVCVALLVSSCVAMHTLGKTIVRWGQGGIEDFSRYSNRYCDSIDPDESSDGAPDSSTAVFGVDLNNPLDRMIDAATKESVFSGQKVEGYRFHMFGSAFSGGNYNRLILDREGNLRLLITFNSPISSSESGAHPIHMIFIDIEKTVAEGIKNKNFFTDAAAFVAKEVASHESGSVFGPHDRIANKDFFIKTNYGLFCFFKLKDSSDIFGLRQKKFDEQAVTLS